MWRKLPYSKPLFLSCVIENGYRIYITDYIKIWWAHYKENEFLNLVKESNDDLEMDSDDQFLQLGLKMLLQPETLKKLDITFGEKTVDVSMTQLCGFPVCLFMKLAEGSREMFFKNITQQLLKTVHDLRTSEKELRVLLLKKDNEIEEYKNETDVRLAMYLKTGVFRDEIHMGKHTMYENHFGTLEVSKCLLDKVMDETEDRVIVKQENLHVSEPRLKVEPDSQPIKKEPNMSENGIQNISNLRTVKGEIKHESSSIISVEKKRRKILKL